MLPPAPGLLSTTTCWPHISESRAPMMRPTASMPPPGVNGTTSLTMRLGQPPCASAAPGARTGKKTGATTGATAEAAARRIRPRRSSMMSLLDLDPGGLDDRAPLVGFRSQPRIEFAGRRRHDRDADLHESGLDGGLSQDRDGVGVDFLDDVDRCLGRYEECIPRGDIETGQGVRNRRKLHRSRKPLGRADRKTAQLAGAHLLQHPGGGVEHHVDASGDHVVERRRHAAIGHVRHLETRHALEQLARKVWRGAYARRRKGELAAIGLAMSDELLDRFRWRGIRHYE